MPQFLNDNANFIFGGLVLCGGQSRRMGGDKAWLSIGEETFLQRVIRTLSGCAKPIVVAAAVGQTLPPLPPEVQIVRDSAANCGPLAGLEAGLQTLSPFVSRALVITCDAPLVSVELLRMLVAVKTNADLLVINDGTRTHPFPGNWSIGVLPKIAAALISDQFKVGALLKRLNIQELALDDVRTIDPELQSLRNVNTPDDYQALLRFLAERASTER